MKRLRLLVLFVLLGACAVAACMGTFDPASKVTGVRLFAVRADKPYAKPGELVRLEALVGDARQDKARPVRVYWIPVICLNPRDDLYYLCFGGGAGDGGPNDTLRLVPVGPLANIGADGGPGGGEQGENPLERIPRGIDLGPFLPQGPTFEFTMPSDAIQARPNAEVPYGLAIVFQVVCAGQVRFAERDPSGGPQQIPLLCTDEDGNPLPPSDYVIALSRVYSYENRTNTNPVIEKVTLDGQDVDLAAGITIPPCVADRRANCRAHEIDVRVSDSSWEPNPTDLGAQDLREQIWVTYYSDMGDLGTDARLLFDSRRGRAPNSPNEYRAPYETMDGTIWAVVHDNRGGTAWAVIPVHVR